MQLKLESTKDLLKNLCAKSQGSFAETLKNNNYKNIATDIGSLVQEKNEAYGDSFGQACRILEVLYPEGISPHQYRDALAITRVIDKLFRLANKKDAFGESPWRDICGYALLGIANDERDSRHPPKEIDPYNSRVK